MSVSKAIRKILKEVNKSYLDLVPILKMSDKYVNVKINRGPHDTELIKAIAEVTNLKEEEIIKRIDKAKREEQKEVSADGKIHELEDKIKLYELALSNNETLLRNYELTIKLLNERGSTIEQLNTSQLDIIDLLKKLLNDREKELEKANKLIDKLEEKIKKN